MILRSGLWLLALARVSIAHVFWLSPHTRASCFHEMPLALDDDTIFRENPCGRPSTGTKGAIVRGASACVYFRATVAHQASYRIAMAAGIAAGDGVKQRGEPTFQTEFDKPENEIVEFSCSQLPGGCLLGDPQGRGDYRFPLRVPNTTEPGVYTLQLRQYSEENHWYYYDCADVLVVNSTASIPAELRDSWKQIDRPFGCAFSFEPISYPNPVYTQESIIFGSIAVATLALLLYDAISIGRWIRLQRGKAVLFGSYAFEQAAAMAEPPSKSCCLCGCDVCFRCCCSRDRARLAAWECRRGLKEHRLTLVAQACAVLVAFAAAAAVVISWKTCAFRPSPVFGPDNP